jgi:glucokinase
MPRCEAQADPASAGAPRGATRLYLGVDLGGTKISVRLWKEVLDRTIEEPRLEGSQPVVWRTLPGGPDPNIEKMLDAAKSLLAAPAFRGGRLAAIGVSGGGPLDPESGRILSVPNLPGWVDVPIVRRLAEPLEAPAYLENDANACAVAEWQRGAGRGAKNLAFLTCSTGIGAGLILDGRLYRGARRLAGEVGHMTIVPGGLPCGCGARGCLEAYASGAGMARRLAILREAGDAPGHDLPADAKGVVERAKTGDAWAVGFLRETAEHLAVGIANLVFALDLERVILGTIPTASGDLLFRPVREAVTRRLWPVFREGLEIVPSQLWPEIGDHAALAVARDLPALVGAR